MGENTADREKTPAVDWRRRMAINVASMLPDNKDDALKTLDYARDLVEGFVFAPDKRDGG